MALHEVQLGDDAGVLPVLLTTIPAVRVYACTPVGLFFFGCWVLGAHACSSVFTSFTLDASLVSCAFLCCLCSPKSRCTPAQTRTREDISGPARAGLCVKGRLQMHRGDFSIVFSLSALSTSPSPLCLHVE